MLMGMGTVPQTQAACTAAGGTWGPFGCGMPTPFAGATAPLTTTLPTAQPAQSTQALLSTPVSSSGGDMGCDAGYALDTDPNGNPICYGIVAACPAGSTCSIIPGIADTSIYLGVGAVVALFALASVFGGSHR